MLLRLLAESLLATGPSLIDLRRAEQLENSAAGGRALSVRSMMSRQMLMALAFERLKQVKKARARAG